MLAIWDYDFSADPLILDATLQAVVSRSAQITRNPVEVSGSGLAAGGTIRIGDHRQITPNQYRATALLLDWPSDSLLARRNSDSGRGQPGLDGVLENAQLQDQTRAAGMLERLREIHRTHELCNLDTDLETIFSVGLESLTSEQAGRGAIRVQMVWSEVLITSASAEAFERPEPKPKPEAAKKAAKKRPAAKKGTKPVEKPQSESGLYRARRFFGLG